MRSFTYIFLFFGSYLFGLRHCPFYALHLPLPHFTVIKGANLRHIVFPYSARDCGQMSVFGWEVRAQRHGPSESDGIRLDYGHDPPIGHQARLWLNGSTLRKSLSWDNWSPRYWLGQQSMWWKRKELTPFSWNIHTLDYGCFLSWLS